MSIVKIVVCDANLGGTGFCTVWNGEVVIATCDHLFINAAKDLLINVELDVDGQRGTYEVRRHPTADVAIVRHDPGYSPLQRLTDTGNKVQSQNVSVTGFPAGKRETVTMVGSSRGQRTSARKLHNNAGVEIKIYEGEMFACSLQGTPGLSGAPVLVAGSVVGLYSVDARSKMLTEAFHAGHIDEIA